MKARTRLFAALAVPVVAGAGLLASAGGAHADTVTSYSDTSLQASPVWEHAISGSAGARDVQGSPTVKVSGLEGAQGSGVTYALQSGSLIDGVTISASFAPAGTAQGGGTDTANQYGNVVLSGSGTPTNTGANEDGTVVLKVTDADGDEAVVTVPVVVGVNSVRLGHGGALTDEIGLITSSNDNTTGAVDFSAPSNLGTTVTITEINVPYGLTPGNPLKPGTAVPGRYNNLSVQATDAGGAVATGNFLLKVNGNAVTTRVPVPVLSHGSATYVSATRENVYFDTTISTWVHFQIVGPGAINGHEGWVYATAGSLNKAVYSGLEANHGYTVYYTPVGGSGSTEQIPGTHTGYVFFVSNRP